MKIGVFGTGTVGRTIAGKLDALNHAVVIGTRDVARTMRRSEPDGFGNPPFSVWQKTFPGIRLTPLSETAAHGEILVNATNGSGSLETLKSVKARLKGKVLIDIANPLDFSKGTPPTLFVKDNDSLAEQLQRAFPAARVVKTLNTMTAALMVNPLGTGNGDHSVFISGNDGPAKTIVTELLQSFGWKDIIDLGDISTARGAEMILPLWLRLWEAMGSADFNFKIVR